MRWVPSAYDLSDWGWLGEKHYFTDVPGRVETEVKYRLLIHNSYCWHGTGDASTQEESAVELGKQRLDTRWVFEIINSSDANGATLIDTTIVGINRLIAANNFEYVDNVLDAVPVETAGRHVLLTLARATYPVNMNLARWRPFTFRVRDAFADRGLDARKLLRGLLD